MPTKHWKNSETERVIEFGMWQRPCGCCFYAEALEYNISVFGHGVQETVKNARLACLMLFDDEITVSFRYYANN